MSIMWNTIDKVANKIIDIRFYAGRYSFDCLDKIVMSCYEKLFNFFTYP